jgi:hypothetical protein
MAEVEDENESFVQLVLIGYVAKKYRLKPDQAVALVYRYAQETGEHIRIACLFALRGEPIWKQLLSEPTVDAAATTTT